ncbi:MAG TPA: peptidoglycan-binding protein, partial [Candidatus Paceibacterota bacterium]|nr:peptidoglycan-binding protein [Candidatus Paceibacterota bacterium]
MVATTNAIAKIAAVVAGLGLVATSFAAFAAPAKAATTDELQAQITALLAQIAALQGGSSASASATFTMDLTLGSSGAEVTALQNWLISKGYSIPAGATGYFGAQTQSALAAWQAANGVTPAAGYFGPITRAKVNAMAGGSTGGNTGNTGGLSGGEASLEDLQSRDGADDEVELGGTAEVAEFEVDVKDGDIELSRLDLTFDSSAVGTGDDDEPWDVFGEVTISVDGKEVASEDVSDEDDWLDNDGTNGEYVFRFTGLDAVVREDDSAIITVSVEADGGADLGTDDQATWELYIDTDGLRGTDGEGIEQYAGDDSENVTFDVVEEGEDDALDIRRSSTDPDSTTLKVEDDKKSDWYTIFAFDLEADEDGGDIELNTIPVVFTTSATTSLQNDIINDAKIVIDGEEFDDFDWGTGGNASTTYFDVDGDFTVDAGETVTVEVMVEFRSQVGNYVTGSTISAAATGTGFDAEGADDVTVGGSATGDTHTLQLEGIDVETNDGDNYIADATSVDGGNDYGEFAVVVDITAFESDVFISATSSAFTYQIEDSAGAATTTLTGTYSATVSSDADVDSGNYVIDEGSTEEFT